jgi:hypothetical protein
MKMVILISTQYHQLSVPCSHKTSYSVQLNSVNKTIKRVLFAEITSCTANATFPIFEPTNWSALEDVIRVLAAAALIGTLITVGALLPFG